MDTYYISNLFKYILNLGNNQELFIRGGKVNKLDTILLAKKASKNTSIKL